MHHQYSTPQQQDRSNLSGLFSHSKAERLLQRICNNVEKHEIEITSLRCDIDSSHAQITKDIDNIYSIISSVKSQMEDLDNRVRIIEDSIRIPGTPPSSKVSIGDAILSNRRTLAKTLNLVSEKADSDVVKESLESQSNDLKKYIENLKNELASNDVVEKLNEAINAVVTRVDAIANTKVDKCMIATLSADASCIKNYANFVRSTQTTTTKIENDVTELITNSKETELKVKEMLEQIQTLNEVVHEYPTIDKFGEVESIVHSLMKQIQKKADTSSLLELRESKILESVDQLKTIEDDIRTLYSAHQTLAKHLTKRLDNMYDKSGTDSTLSNYVKSDEFEDKFSSVMREIMETKECRQIFLRLQQDLRSMESDLCITKRKADLAARFVGLCGKGDDDDYSKSSEQFT